MERSPARITKPSTGYIFIIFLLFAIGCSYFSLILSAGGIVLVALLYYVSKRLERRKKREILRYLETSSLSADVTLHASLTRFPMPALIAQAETGEILWTNELFAEATGHHDCALKQTLRDLNPEFSTGWLVEGKPQYPEEVRIGDQLFWVYGNLMARDDDSNMMLMLYFVCCTEFVQLKEVYAKTRPIIAIISIDNYEELVKEASDSEKSSMLAEIDKHIGNWTRESRALLRKYDRDKYMFVLETVDFDKLVQQKFSVLEDVRVIENREGVAATLSIGIGREADSMQEAFRFAGVALDMALSRGGDQAVIKTKYNFEFFGGLSKEVEKRTKVKSRVVANALGQMIKDSSQVMIMGHKMSDLDCVGAAVGMACAVRHRERPVHIVIDTNRTLSKDLLNRIEAHPEFADLFLHPDDAMVKADYNTLLIVVDTNRPDYVESQALLESINKVAVIDHHRRAASYIQNFALNLHEPYASSASELVCEMLQYMLPTSGITKIEAESLLAGLFLDTKGFTVKTGVRTFEAAAYLKRAGADITEVKKLFMNTFEEYMTCQRVAARAQDAGDGIIVAVTGEDVGRISAGQTADHMLDIIGVNASVVAYQTGEDVMISARSMGKINVQVMMEFLGGGGNHSSAGAQMRNITWQEAEVKIYQAIAQYKQNQAPNFAPAPVVNHVATEG